jgi:hypothetical protein
VRRADAPLYCKPETPEPEWILLDNHKFLSRGDRTVDQMIQSARSGKKNILEGSKAALTFKETEIKLTNVGRASLEELLDDYRDYLRVREHREWDKNSKEARIWGNTRSPSTLIG